MQFFEIKFCANFLSHLSYLNFVGFMCVLCYFFRQNFVLILTFFSSLSVSAVAFAKLICNRCLACHRWPAIHTLTLQVLTEKPTLVRTIAEWNSHYFITCSRKDFEYIDVQPKHIWIIMHHISNSPLIGSAPLREQI